MSACDIPESMSLISGESGLTSKRRIAVSSTPKHFGISAFESHWSVLCIFVTYDLIKIHRDIIYQNLMDFWFWSIFLRISWNPHNFGYKKAQIHWIIVKFCFLRGATQTQGVPPTPSRGEGGGSLKTVMGDTYPLPAPLYKKRFFLNIWSDMRSYRSQMPYWIIFSLGKLLETIWDMIPMILQEKVFWFCKEV